MTNINQSFGSDTDILRIWDGLTYLSDDRRSRRVGWNKDGSLRETGWRRSYFQPDRLEKNAKRQAERLQTALYRYEVRCPQGIGPTDRFSTDLRLRREGLYTHPGAPLFLHPLMMVALDPVCDRDDLRKVTILDRSWNTDMEHLHYDASNMRRMVRESLAHLNGIFAIEFAINRGTDRAIERWPVSFHVEGLCWGLETQRQARNANRYFVPSLVGIPTIVRKSVFCLPGTVAYFMKDPYRLYDSYPGPSNTTHRIVVDLAMRGMNRIWQRFQSTSWTEMLFGVNDGRHLLQDFRSLVVAANPAWRLSDR